MHILLLKNGLSTLLLMQVKTYFSGYSLITSKDSIGN
jgi:hypothetical protein